MRLPRAARLVAYGLAGVGLVALAGCGTTAVIMGDSATDGTAGVIDASVLLSGDCINAVSGSLLAGISAVPCEDSHDWEVYFQFRVAGTADDPGVFPGDATIVASAEEACSAEFLPFLGLGTDPGAGSGANDATAAYGYTYLTPLESSWSDNDHHVVSCLIGDMNGQVSGSLAGAGVTTTATG